MREQLTTTERLVACSLIRTRFDGRAQLVREAQGSQLALTRLEVRLGLATEADLAIAVQESVTRRLVKLYRQDRQNEALGYLLAGDDYAARRRMAARRYAVGESATWNDVGRRTAQLVAPDECAAIDAVRDGRALRRALDPLAERRPGYAEATVALRRAKATIAAARFREATHQHRTRVHLCSRGSERAIGATDKVRPGDVGLGKSYSDVGFWVTTSTHDWYVSPAILSPEVRALNAEAPVGVVYLRADLRVVQGRGTALKVETRGPKGGWS